MASEGLAGLSPKNHSKSTFPLLKSTKPLIINYYLKSTIKFWGMSWFFYKLTRNRVYGRLSAGYNPQNGE
jgi:hypothetical protein